MDVFRNNRWFYFSALTVSVAIFLISLNSAVREYVYSNVDNKFLYNARDALGYAPKLSSKVKVIAFDDQMQEVMKGDDDLAIDNWGYLIKALNKAGADRIYIDKQFTHPLELNMFQYFEKFYSSVDATVVTAGLPQALPQARMNSIESKLSLPKGTQGYFEAFPPEVFGVKGPHSVLRSYFNSVGHVSYEKGQDQVVPMIFDSNGEAVKHFAFMAETFNLSRSSLLIEDSYQVPLNHFGGISVNWLDLKHLQNSVLSLRDVFHELRNNDVDSMREKFAIEQGDWVLIAPNHITGGTDFIESSLGRVPGPFIHAALLSSLHENNWLKEIKGFEPILFVILILFSLAVGFIESPSWRYVLSIVASLSPLILCFTLFVSQDFYFQFTPICLSVFVFNSMSNFRHWRSIVKHNQLIKSALEGVVSENHLERLLNNPEIIQAKPVGKVVTVMFIDLVGFSKIASGKSAREIYQLVYSKSEEISRIVHKYGGCIDKVLGDGLLCYFGHDHTTEEYDGNHAMQAIKCAIQLQEESVDSFREENISDFMPLRIGVNTCPVIFGSLKATNRLDPTIIGDGVNYTKRLETACDVFRVCLSQSTKEFIDEAHLQENPLHVKNIAVKHFDEPLSVFELELSDVYRDKAKTMMSSYMKMLGKKRVENRSDLGNVPNLYAVIDDSKVSLVNHSLSGIAVKCSTLYGNNVKLHIKIVVEGLDGSGEIQFPDIIGEVRWNEPTSSDYLHGIRFVNLSDGQKEQVREKILALHSGKKAA